MFHIPVHCAAKIKKTYKNPPRSNYMNFVIVTPNWVSQEQKIQFLTARFRDILWFRKWHPFKQTKTKNGRHFFISTFDELQLCFFVQKDSSTVKVLKMQFVFGWDYENLKESFWTKKQSWKLWKVDIKKWHPFFFVCLNGCHFLNQKISLNLAVKNIHLVRTGRFF